MRELKLPLVGTIMPTPGSPVNLGAAVANLDVVRKNAIQIIGAAIAIEQQLEQIVRDRVFEDAPEADSLFFSSSILAAEWFSFSAKRRLVTQIVNEKKLLQSSEKTEFENILSKVMKLRNAMAHGRVIERSDGTYLSYFENTQQEKRLDDEYWTDVESIFARAFAFTKRLTTKPGGDTVV